MSDPITITLLELTTEIVRSYVSNNSVSASELPILISEVHTALNKLQSRTAAIEEQTDALKPAVNPKKSITEHHITCLEDGKQFRSMKRHLRFHHNMTPEEYREKWGLPHDYPMVAPAYRAQRSEMAKALGLGRKLGSKNNS